MLYITFVSFREDFVDLEIVAVMATEKIKIITVNLATTITAIVVVSTSKVNQLTIMITTKPSRFISFITVDYLLFYLDQKYHTHSYNSLALTANISQSHSLLRP